jgi:hypothetical protein
MRRRDFIAGLGATAWPLAARAQQGDPVRRVGVLMAGDENDPVRKTWLSAFIQVLASLGWIDGRNVRIDLRWGRADINRIQALAHELVGLQPDIVVASSSAATVALQRETRTIPILFENVGDPVASGIVPRLNRPGGNITGFANVEPMLGGKWLEMLSEIAPGLKRAASMFKPDTASVLVHMPSFEMAARSLKVEPIVAPVHDNQEIETAIIALGREPGGGLVLMPDVFTSHASRGDHIGGGPEQRTRGLFPLHLCQKRWLALLRNRLGKPLASRRQLCGSHPARRKAGRSPGAVPDQIRIGPEPQDRSKSRAHLSARHARYRRHSNRIGA